MTSGVRVIDLTSRLGGQALAQIGVSYAAGQPLQRVALSGGERAPTIQWGGAPGADEALTTTGRQGALVILVGPGSVQAARAVLERALREQIACVRVFLMPSALVEEITLKGMVPRDHAAAHLYRLPDSSPETLWFVLIEEFHKLTALYGVRSLQSAPQEENDDSMSTNLNQSMAAAMSIDGALAAALVDYRSGMCLAQAGTAVNLDLAAAGNTQVVRAKLQTMESLGLRKGIEDILITLGDQYHLIRLVPNNAGLFLYLVLDKIKGNLALARYKLTDIERGLKV